MTGETIKLFLASLLLIAAGALCILKPEWVWKVSEAWKSNAADGPSEWYEAHTRLAGVAFLFIGLFFLIALFLLR